MVDIPLKSINESIHQHLEGNKASELLIIIELGSAKNNFYDDRKLSGWYGVCLKNNGAVVTSSVSQFQTTKYIISPFKVILLGSYALF